MPENLSNRKNKYEQAHYLTPSRLGQRLIIWGFYPSEAIVLIALAVLNLLALLVTVAMAAWTVANDIKKK